jgi:uncharacterized membrane protein
MKWFFQFNHQVYKFTLLLFFCITSFAFAKGQQSNKQKDSLIQQRIGFSTLFNITATGNAENHFNFNSIQGQLVLFRLIWINKELL